MKKERRAHSGMYGTICLGRGKTKTNVDCPFCNRQVEAYVWSLSGSGKKCKCGALITRGNAYKDIKEPVLTPPQNK